ncbi:MAG TPA: SRPBCC domain-containing protein [Candidatus Kapabacteria bacterium]|nr:SRPBCC domain-containing protein [Candidatus Kapabacteria bacterium]
MTSTSMDHTVRVEHHFEAPAARLFAACSDPEQLAQWAWGSLGRLQRAEVDFRVGGSFLAETTRPDGAVWRFEGTYTAIEPEARIAHTLVWHAPMGYPTVPEHLEIAIADNASGSTLELTHSGLPDQRSADGHREGWSNVLETLADFLRRSS